MPRRIPFNRPHLTGLEGEYFQRALAGGHAAGDGAFTARASRLLERTLGVSRGLLTPSGTDALELAALLTDVGPGDEVIVPSFTFASTASAFVLRGARPIFADCRRDTLNLDEHRLPWTARTKAIVPVHYGGVACAMDEITDQARAHAAFVVEDNAHGLFGRYHGRALGALGDLGALSFHATKTFSCGEGGALLLRDPAMVERAENLRNKGTDRARFLAGRVKAYRWVDAGSSFLLSDLLAAVLLAQLRARESILERRRRLWQTYAAALGALPVPRDCEVAHCLYYLLLDKPKDRDRLIAFLKARGITAAAHYSPLHLSPFGRRLGGKKGQCPNVEWASARIVRLPFYTDLAPSDTARIIDAVVAFFRGRPRYPKRKTNDDYRAGAC